MADILTKAMIEDDLDVVDGLELVTVLVINPDTGATVATIVDVPRLRRVITGEDAALPGEGSVPKTTARHHLKAKPLPGMPKDHDKIVDSDGTWRILSASATTFGTRYVCETVKV